MFLVYLKKNRLLCQEKFSLVISLPSGPFRVVALQEKRPFFSAKIALKQMFPKLQKLRLIRPGGQTVNIGTGHVQELFLMNEKPY